MVLKEKKCIFIKIPEMFDMKNFQQKNCIFLGEKKFTIKVHWLVDLLLSAFLAVYLILPLSLFCCTTLFGSTDKSLLSLECSKVYLLLFSESLSFSFMRDFYPKEKEMVISAAV